MLVGFGFGCGDGDVLPRRDAGVQTGPGSDDDEDSGTDPGVDPGEDDEDPAREDDAAVEPGMDAGPDRSNDAAADPLADGALDASGEAGAEVQADAAADASSDAGPDPIDAATDASSDAGPDPIDAATDASSDAGPNPIDAATDASSDAGADALVDAASDADADAGDSSNQDAAADAGSDADAAVAVAISFSTTSSRPLCHGGATGSISFVSVSGGTPAYTYSIHGGVDYQTSSTFSGLSAGTYQLAVRDAAGHVQTDSLVLSEPGVLQITDVSSTDVRLTCGGLTQRGTARATVSGGTAPHVFAWSPNDELTGDGTSSVVDLPGSPSGITYTVNVTDANGCSAGPESVVIVDNTAAMMNYYGLYCFHAGIFDHFGLPEPVSFADCFTDEDATNANLFFMTWADEVAQSTAVDAVAVTIAYLDGIGDTKYTTMLPITECLTGTPDYAALVSAANGQDVYSSDFLQVIITYITANSADYHQRFVAIDAEFDNEVPFSAGQLWGDFVELVSDDP